MSTTTAPIMTTPARNVIVRSSLSWTAIFKVIVALLLPPLAVLWHKGLGLDLLINILLTLLGYIPGEIHALWLLTKTSEPLI